PRPIANGTARPDRGSSGLRKFTCRHCARSSTRRRLDAAPRAQVATGLFGFRVAVSSGRMADRLREGDEITAGEAERAAECARVDGAAEHTRQPLRRAIEIDVLADETGVHRGVKAALVRRHIAYALAVRDVDQVERRAGDEILLARLRADVGAHTAHQ